MKKVLFFDTETNGFQGSSVLSFSAYVVGFERDGKVTWLETINRFYFPKENFDASAIAVNHLDKETLMAKRAGVAYKEHFLDDDELLEKIRGCDKFVAHNANFDISFLPFSVRSQDILCTMLMNTNIIKIVNFQSYDRHGRWRGYKWPKLIEAAHFYKIPCNEQELHGSIYDVDILFKVFFEMLKVPELYQRIWRFIFDD
ncbi:MAG: hypothetical protein LBR07_08355 [Puniceicoccales bacterium]|jgi:DNA polymerase-3 subunit epsilon|nr:hypothetical protein [Puniceicoccales bacterium]